MTARAFAVAGAIATGALVAEAAPPSAAAAVACAALPLAATLASRGRRAGLVIVGAAALGFALAGLRIASLDGALADAGTRHAAAVLDGEVLTEPVVEAGAARLVLGARRAELDGRALRIRERAWLTIAPPPAVRAGDLVRAEARLGPATAPSLRRRGLSAVAFASDVAVTGRSRNPLTAMAVPSRAAVRAAAARLRPRDGGLLLGLTIGDTSRLDPADAVDFRRTGLSHLLAVSGANVAYVLGALAIGMRVLRAGRRATVAVLAAALVGFMAVTGFEPSVLRAGAMAAIGILGLAVGARRTATVALAWAAAACIAWDPFLVRSVGFQLSVLATAGILAAAPRIARALPSGRVWAAASAALGAQLAVAPLLVVHFGKVSLVSVAANIAAAPAAGPATVIGMLAAALGAAWEPLGATALAAEPFVAWMRWTAHSLAQVPMAEVATPGAGSVLLLSAALTAIALGAARAASRRRLAPLLLAIALVATGGAWARALGPPPLRGLVVTMIDVGQGEAILVRSEGRTMLVDGGPDGEATLGALAEEGVHRIDLLVATHPHEDHVAGLAVVAARMPVSRALDPGIASELPSYAALRGTLAARDVPVDRARAGLAYRLGGAWVEVLWPPEPLLAGTAEDVNNNSVVLRVRYGSDAVLLAGETQEEAQEALVAGPSALRAAVLKVSHHGSRHMLPAFYAATGARVALIPVGANPFGHPAPETLAALAGMRVLRSDLAGTVDVGLDGMGGVLVRAVRPAA